jgi:hypothetical protein
MPSTGLWGVHSALLAVGEDERITVDMARLPVLLGSTPDERRSDIMPPIKDGSALRTGIMADHAAYRT